MLTNPAKILFRGLSLHKGRLAGEYFPSLLQSALCSSSAKNFATLAVKTRVIQIQTRVECTTEGEDFKVRDRKWMWSKGCQNAFL